MPPSTALPNEILNETNTVRNCEKVICKYKGLLCKIQEIPVLDVVLKLSIQCEETYLEPEVADFQCLTIIII